MNTVAQNIKRLRKRDNLSQETLAEKLNVTRQAVSNWETGRTQPDIETLLSIAAAFDVEAAEVIYGERPKPEAYPLDRKKRLTTILILSVTTVVLILLELFLRPYLKHIAGTYYIAIPMWIYTVFCPPMLYFFAALLFFQVLSLWKDMRILNASARKSLLFAGIAVIICYLFLAADLFFIPGLFSIIIEWGIISTPALFILPGTAIFFATNQ